MSWKTFDFISEYFEPSRLLLPSLHELCMCHTVDNIDVDTFPWEYVDTPTDRDFIEDITNSSLDTGRAIVLWPHQGYLYNQRPGIQLLNKVTDKIVQSLVLKKQFMDYAKEKIVAVREAWKNKNRKKLEKLDLPDDMITYVGIHHRRTDHLLFETVYEIPHIKKSYFSPAMDLFRRKHLAVVFVYITDEPLSLIHI